VASVNLIVILRKSASFVTVTLFNSFPDGFLKV
jgi:hypothetical protein